jgi:hypothetical protein
MKLGWHLVVDRAKRKVDRFLLPGKPINDARIFWNGVEAAFVLRPAIK